MQVVIVENKTLRGMSTRTTNQNEMNPETAKLGSLWQKFDKEVVVDYQNGERVYGVYYNYESDVNGEFSVLAGFDGDTASQNKALKPSPYPQENTYASMPWLIGITNKPESQPSSKPGGNLGLFCQRSRYPARIPNRF